MKFFKDIKGESWEITINVAAIKKVRDLLNADLLDTRTMLPRLLADPIFLVDVLYCLCKPQADAKNISDEQFGEGMAGDCLGFAKNTLIEELKSFFPSPEERNAVDRLIKKGNEMIGLLRKKSLLKLEQTDMDAKADEILKLFGETSTNSPESPELIPETSPSVN
ncbi:MAG: hypothetical protein FWH27_14750 [Planctomycetaceae bacterium]|nr:hypothetical protein [Planctomycetaceae bacterium]